MALWRKLPFQFAGGKPYSTWLAKKYTLKRTVAFERQRVIGLIIIVIAFVFFIYKGNEYIITFAFTTTVHVCM